MQLNFIVVYLIFFIDNFIGFLTVRCKMDGPYLLLFLIVLHGNFFHGYFGWNHSIMVLVANQIGRSGS